ncbi:HD family hydrolase [uncultured Lentibacter sp.]|uniref:HD domain-containing protein n=1 Tax=uncultured Lentibacter sp. TaxID=1659309 RepID=UPI002604A5AC|nr:HD domain-containing protein [uncultured Lentibacter sp.]
MSQRLDAQMAFLMEADKLKQVLRATTLADGTRAENSGEHSWHIALFALVLGADAPADVSVERVIKMLLLHDIVEIDAGDAPIFADHDASAQAAKEAAAATRLFGLLPPDQAASFRALWDEFEAAQTPDARFAKSLDRFQPPNQNLAAGGGSWVSYETRYETFEARVGTKIKRGAPWLWDWLQPKAEAWFAARGKL